MSKNIHELCQIAKLIEKKNCIKFMKGHAHLERTKVNQMLQRRHRVIYLDSCIKIIWMRIYIFYFNYLWWFCQRLIKELRGREMKLNKNK